MTTLQDAEFAGTLKNESMSESIRKRRRLCGVVELARIYADLGVKELADVIGRDKTRIIPPTGNPKMDMVGSLAGVLEWTVKDVTNALHIRSNSRKESIETRPLGHRRRFENLHRISRRLERKGKPKSARAISVLLLSQAANGRERSIALEMVGRSQAQTGDLDGALISFRNGLNQQGIEFTTHLRLKINLCRAHLKMQHHVEARTIASSILMMIAQDTKHDAGCLRDAEHSARFIRANAVRESIDHGIGGNHLGTARKDLLRSLQIATTERNGHLDEETVAIGAILELDTELGRITRTQAVRRIEEALEIAKRDLQNGVLKDRHRRAWAWWCIFGARIAVRPGASGPLWNKAHTLAQRAIEFSSGPEENLLRAKAYRLSFQAWKGSRESGHDGISWHMGPMQLEIFVKTMGAQIGFMEPGWRILRETGTLDRAKSMDPRTWRKGFDRR